MKSLTQYIKENLNISDIQEHLEFNNVQESIKKLSGQSGIIVFDIDDTLLKANPKSISIYKKEPGKLEKKLSTDEFAKDPDAADPSKKHMFDYREFNDPIKVYDSIVSGTPIIRNLRILDNYIAAGYDFCFLTARSCEDVVKSALEEFLKVRDKNGNLKRLEEEFKKNLSHAVNDRIRKYPGSSDAEKKAHILMDLCNKYDRVVFVDDDDKNVRQARQLGLKNLKVIKAQKSDNIKSIDKKLSNVKEELNIGEALKVSKDTKVNTFDFDDGVYAYFAGGYLSNNREEIVNDQKNVLGVAIITGDHNFVISKYSLGSSYFCLHGKPNLNVLNGTKTGDSKVAVKDLDGKKNTEEWLSIMKDRDAVMWRAGEAFGGEGYLPSAGEFAIIDKYKEEVNKILVQAGGEKILTRAYWTSTLFNTNDYHWTYDFGTSKPYAMGNAYKTKFIAACLLEDLKVIKTKRI